MKEFVLSNGVKAPALAYGTWLIKNEDAARCVKMALEAGYRHIDTAQAYGNEEGVGQGIRESGLKREEVFITSKVKAELKSYKKAKASIDESLKKLGVDYIDLMLIHCPQPWALFRGPFRYFKQNIQVWKAMEEAYKDGKIRAIGVSNFLVDDLVHRIIFPLIRQVDVFLNKGIQGALPMHLTEVVPVMDDAALPFHKGTDLPGLIGKYFEPDGMDLSHSILFGIFPAFVKGKYCYMAVLPVKDVAVLVHCQNSVFFNNCSSDNRTTGLDEPQCRRNPFLPFCHINLLHQFEQCHSDHLSAFRLRAAKHPN